MRRTVADTHIQTSIAPGTLVAAVGCWVLYEAGSLVAAAQLLSSWLAAHRPYCWCETGPDR